MMQGYPPGQASAAASHHLNGHAGEFEEMDTSSTSCLPSRSKPNPFFVHPATKVPYLHCSDRLSADTESVVSGPAKPPQSNPIAVPSPSGPKMYLKNSFESIFTPEQTKDNTGTQNCKHATGPGKGQNCGVGCNGYSPLPSDTVSRTSNGRRRGKRHGRGTRN